VRIKRCEDLRLFGCQNPEDVESFMVKRRFAAVLLTAVAGLLLAVGMAAPASATTVATVAASPAHQICTVEATAFEKRGDTNVVTATRTSCQSSGMAAPNSATANVHVGYGCKDSQFSGTCWYFDVPSPGCAGSSSWGWDTISHAGLSSWEAVGTCSHGTLYDLPVYGGASITCYTCYSLGSMNDKTSSLKVFR
jgi:hypothetical protein